MFRSLLTGLLLLLTLGGCVRTPEFRDEQGNTIPGSIATMEMLTLGGVRQSVWLRGVSTSNPILVLLHGGPGASESALFRHYNAALEEHFLVVYWEQRGTGRSFHPDIPPETMTVDQFVQDLDALVEHVTRRFSQEKVILLGHSWGTALGTIYAAQYPEKVAAYAGVAQIANMPAGDKISYEFALGEAVRRGDSRAVAALQESGGPPYSSYRERLETGKWVERYGGMFHADLSTGKLIWAALGTDEASLKDLMLFGRGNRFSLVQLEDEHGSLQPDREYLRFDVPILFLLGRHDRHIPSSLAADYFESIDAPCKRLVWFEHSAHNPPFEEPEKFNDVLPAELSSLTMAAEC